MATSRLISTTGGLIYLIALDSLEKIEVQYVPQELIFTRKPRLGELVVVGRNLPKNHQTSGHKFLKFQLDFYSIAEGELGRDDVIKKIRLLESWTYNEGSQRNPEKIKLVYGNMFRDEVWTISDINVRMSDFEKQTFVPQQAYVDLTLKLDPASNIKRSDVR